MKKNDLDDFIKYVSENHKEFPANFSKYEIYPYTNETILKGRSILVESEIYNSCEVYPFPFYKPISSLLIPIKENEK